MNPCFLLEKGDHIYIERTPNIFKLTASTTTSFKKKLKPCYCKHLGCAVALASFGT